MTKGLCFTQKIVVIIDIEHKKYGNIKHTKKSGKLEFLWIFSEYLFLGVQVL